MMIDYAGALAKIETYLASPEINHDLVMVLRLEWMLEQWPRTFPPRVPNEQERVEAFDRALQRVQARMRAAKPVEWFYEI